MTASWKWQGFATSTASLVKTSTIIDRRRVCECLNVQVGQLEGFPTWLSAVASRGACLTLSTAWPGGYQLPVTVSAFLTVTPCRSAEKVAEEGEELVLSHNTA